MPALFGTILSRPRSTAIYYRERANFWRDKVAATPGTDRHCVLYQEVSESYERLAATYEQRERSIKNRLNGDATSERPPGQSSIGRDPWPSAN